ncbi:hypothetical protein [Streptomyces sp. NPDC005408]|uniref:hypothetical protein n=1 Tax=Streptomyces sp. NPDC005408 TaxID=3155341 RepID=UPI0033ACC25D
MERVSVFHGRMSPDAPRSEEFAPPLAAEAQWRWWLALVVGGVALLVTGEWQGGALAIVVGGGGLIVVESAASRARVELASWKNRMICKACDRTFDP